MARRRQQHQRHLIAAGGVLVGTAPLLACYSAYHSLLQAQRSCLENNVPPRSEHRWLHLGLCKLLFQSHRTTPSEASLRSCSWPWVLLRDVAWPVISRTRQVDARKLLSGLLAMVQVMLMARELVLFVRHLQHAAPDTFDCSCSRNNLHSLSRTAHCTFSAHRQDLYHLLQVLVEETASFCERLSDRIKFSRELARVLHQLEVWSDRYAKMLLAKAFIKGYEIGKVKGRRLGIKVGRAAGFVAGWQKGRLEGYARGWKDGYDMRKKRGFQRGRRVGYDRGYNDGYDEGKAKGMAEVMVEAGEHTRQETLTK